MDIDTGAGSGAGDAELPPHEQAEQTAPETPAQAAPVDPNAPLAYKLHLRGVDDLSTAEIKAYVDFHAKPGYCFAARDKYRHQEYRIEWVNDSELNLVFCCADQELAQWGATKTLKLLTKHELGQDVPDVDPLAERECWDLLKIASGPGAGKSIVRSNIAQQYAQDASLDADNVLPPVAADVVVAKDPIVLHVRYATGNDRKVERAREQSRYYLLHGEPDEIERDSRRRRRGRGRGRGERKPAAERGNGNGSGRGNGRGRFYEDARPDLVTGQYRERGRPERAVSRADEGDLFPELLARQQQKQQQKPAEMDIDRDRSPGRAV